MKLAYTAYDNSGQAVTGTVESADVATATETLRHKGLYVAQITESAAATAKSQRKLALKPRAGQRIKKPAVFTRQLCVLISSGTQLMEALGALERQAKPGPWRDTISDIRAEVEQGASLSTAMEPHPEYFDPVYCSLVAAGESTGRLTEMLDHLAALKQKQVRIRNSIVGALIYPSMLVVLAVGIFILLLGFVVPRFATLFDTLDVPLPASTQALVTISEVFRSYWWAAVLLLIGAIIAMIAYLRTANGKRFRDTAILNLPYIGNIAKSIATARIVCLLGVLLGGHVPILKALRLIRHAAGNVCYADLVAKAEEQVAKGELISLAFSDTKLISPSIYEAIRSGEQSGQMDRLLLNVAEFLDEENEVIVRSLTTIIEPVILVVMGILVGLIAISMFLPLFDLTAMTQGGGI
jgi:type IV pilus assembly protein PilC